MKGCPPNPLVPTGYINSNIPLFFPQPQITHVLTTPAQVYVSPDGSDDPANVGSITSPFASISAALFYVTNTLTSLLRRSYVSLSLLEHMRADSAFPTRFILLAQRTPRPRSSLQGLCSLSP